MVVYNKIVYKENLNFYFSVHIFKTTFFKFMF
jgi:hypothetical protein